MSTTRNVARVLAKGAGLVAGSFALLAAVVFLVPEGNDYALATVRKHAWLEQGGAGKIVFIGGSNLAFGLNSSMVEEATGRHVVNMGMNGYFGVRFMLEETKPSLKSGDVAVLSFEYDNFYKSVDGTSSDLLMVTKARADSVPFLSWRQRIGIIEAVPLVAQFKVMRLVREGGRRIRDAVQPSSAEREADIEKIETLAGFEKHGDLRSHWDVEWKKERELGVDITNTPMDGEVVPLLQSFAREMTERGVTVVISYTPLLRSFYERHEKSIEALHRVLSAATPLVVPSPPSSFVFDERLFFDTVYHLNKDGIPLRTARVVADLEQILESGASPRRTSVAGQPEHDGTRSAVSKP